MNESSGVRAGTFRFPWRRWIQQRRVRSTAGLLHAISIGADANIIGAWLKKGASTEPNSLGNTPLHLYLCARKCDLEGVIMLVNAGVNIEARNKLGVTAFSIAVSRNLSEIAHYLKSKAQIDLRGVNTAKGGTPLHDAAEHGNEMLARFCLEAGANVNARDRLGNTPLIIAMRNRNLVVAELMVDCGADIGLANNQGETVSAIVDAPHMQRLMKHWMSTPDRDGAVRRSNPYNGQ